jgi:hypothetical protein
MLIWIIQAVTATFLGLFAIFPAVGPYNYGVIGLVIGLLAACIIFFELEGELEEDGRGGARPLSRGIRFVLGLLGGTAAGCIWPAAITTGLLWVWLSGGEDDDAPPATA